MTNILRRSAWLFGTSFFRADTSFLIHEVYWIVLKNLRTFLVLRS